MLSIWVHQCHLVFKLTNQDLSGHALAIQIFVRSPSHQIQLSAAICLLHKVGPLQWKKFPKPLPATISCKNCSPPCCTSHFSSPHLSRILKRILIVFCYHQAPSFWVIMLTTNQDWHFWRMKSEHQDLDELLSNLCK